MPLDLSDILSPALLGTVEKILPPVQRFGAEGRSDLAKLSASIDAVDLGLDFARPLLPAQTPAVQYALRTRRVIIADDMGIGKTTEGIAAAIAAKAFPVLVTCPGSLTLNWVKEVNAVAPALKVVVLAGETVYRPEAADVYVISDAVLTNWVSLIIEEIKPLGVIFDECHRFKEAKAKRTKVVIEIAAKVREAHGIVIGLSGTPAKSRTKEILAQLRLLGVLPELMRKPAEKAEWAFQWRYCGPQKVEIETRRGTQVKHTFDGASNTAELNAKLRELCWVQRSKNEVWADMPEKTRIPVYFELDDKQAEAYNDIEARLAIVELGKQKGFVALASLKPTIEHVDKLLAQGEQVIVFAVRRAMVEAIAKHYNAPKIYGGMAVAKVEAAKEAFQSGEARVIVGNLQAMGVGHTLTAATHVVFSEIDFCPSDHVQGEDRAWRYGQTNAVTAWYLLAANTVDEDWFDLIFNEKATRVNTLITGKADDGIDVLTLTVDQVAALLAAKRLKGDQAA